MRRFSVLGWVIAIATVAIPAHGELSKADCVAAHEQGQRLWKADRILEGIELLNKCAVETCPAVVSQECNAQLEEAKAAQPTVVVQAVEGEARGVRIDGVEAQGSGPHAVNPGEHTASVLTEDGVWVEARFSVGRGEKGKRVEVRVPVKKRVTTAASAPPAPAPPLVLKTRLAPAAAPYEYALAAAGLVGLGLFTGFGLAGLKREHDMQRDCAPYCAQSRVDAMHRDYVIADVSLGIGVAAVAAAIVILHVWREPRLEPHPRRQ